MIPAVAPATVLWFLPVLVPVAIWVSWSDMRFMKIPNRAVVVLVLAYAVLGLAVLPLAAWAWGFALMAGVLSLGFAANMAGLVGAGDAKFAAAMAPYFVGSNVTAVLALFAACLLAAFASHRALGRVPAFRRQTADWLSWSRRDFPMGLALSGTLLLYPLTGLVSG